MTLRARSSSKTQDAMLVGTRTTQSLEFTLASRTNSTKAKSLLGGPPVDALHNSDTRRPSRPASKLQKRRPIPGNNAHRGTARLVHETREEQCSGWCVGEEASTPALGCFDTIHSAVAASTSCLHGSRSCSTMRSSHDHSSMPSVSQNASVVPARDMTLRRGHPPMTIPLPQKVMPMVETRELMHDPWYTDLNNNTKRRRPTRLDFSTLFQKSRGLKGPLLSPRGVGDNPTALSDSSEPLQHTPSPRKKWLRWGGSPAKETPRSADEFHRDPSWSRDLRRVASQPYSKGPGPKLRARPDNAELDEYMRFMASVEQSDSSTEEPPKVVDNIRPMSQISSSSSSIRTLTSKPSPPAENPIQLPRNQPQKAQQGFFDDSRQDGPPASSESQFVETDLHIQSVLALSFSDSESDEDNDRRAQATSPNGNQTKRGSVRGSRKEPTVTENLPKQSHDLLKHIDTRSFSLPTSATKVFERSKSIKIESSNNQLQSTRAHQAAQGGNGTSFDGGLVPTVNSVPVPTKVVQEKQDPRLNRVMAVTREEEKLLEAMREKRANMLGQKIPVDTPFRPKTAGTDKQSSSFFEADMSSFPAPPKSGPHQVSHYPRSVMSTEDLSLSSHLIKDDQSFSAVTRSLTTLSRVSSEFSSNPSDVALSPLSPVTPPRLSSDYNRTIRAPLTGPSANDHAKGHLRKRTVSSDMLFFQGLERQETRGGREKEALGQWALQACS